MRPHEVLAEIYQRQGYLIYKSPYVCSVGDIWPANDDPYAGLPLRVIGIATKEEHERQRRIHEELDPSVVRFNSNYYYFYRVEAAD